MKKLESRTRQLSNGQWVGEICVSSSWFSKKWLAADSTTRRHAWEPGDAALYADCLCDTEEEAQEVLGDVLAKRFGQ